MKKFYYLAAGIVTILVTIIACEKSSIGVDEVLTVKNDVLMSKSDASDVGKVTICHWDDGYVDVYTDGIKTGTKFVGPAQWVQISISENAKGKHFANHGDNGFMDHEPFLSPEGTYYMRWVSNSEQRGLHVITIDTYDECVGTFSGTGFALDFGNKPSIVEATFNPNTQTYQGTYYYPNYDVNGEPFGFEAFWNGTVFTIISSGVGEFESVPAR